MWSSGAEEVQAGEGTLSTEILRERLTLELSWNKLKLQNQIISVELGALPTLHKEVSHKIIWVGYGERSHAFVVTSRDIYSN